MQMTQVNVYLHIFDGSPCAGVIFARASAGFRVFNWRTVNYPVDLYHIFWFSALCSKMVRSSSPIYKYKELLCVYRSHVLGSVYA